MYLLSERLELENYQYKMNYNLICHINSFHDSVNISIWYRLYRYIFTLHQRSNDAAMYSRFVASTKGFITTLISDHE